MSRGLQQFFATVGPFLLGQQSHADTTARLYGDGATTTARLDADRLAIYGRFCRNHRHEALTVFQSVRDLIVARAGEATWDDLVERYFVAHPMHHFELNRNGEFFAQFLQDGVDLGALGLPDYLPAMADFEWWDWLVTIAPNDPADADPDAGPMRLASTVDLRPYEYDFVTWLDGDWDDESPRPADPGAGACVVLFWRDRDLQARREPATPLEMLVIKAIVEGIPVDAALAQQVGIAAADLAETRADLGRAGIVLGAGVTAAD